MKQVKIAAIGFIAFLGAVTTSAADEPFEAKITYNTNQSATQIYESLNRSIRDACQARARNYATASFYIRFRVKTDCRRQFMNSAVAAINMPELTALHNHTSPVRVRMAAQ
jgi:hypothetical protein